MKTFNSIAFDSLQSTKEVADFERLLQKRPIPRATVNASPR